MLQYAVARAVAPCFVYECQGPHPCMLCAIRFARRGNDANLSVFGQCEHVLQSHCPSWAHPLWQQLHSSCQVSNSKANNFSAIWGPNQLIIISNSTKCGFRKTFSFWRWLTNLTGGNTQGFLGYSVTRSRVVTPEQRKKKNGKPLMILGPKAKKTEGGDKAANQCKL